MRRILAITLVVVIAMVGLASCSSSTGDIIDDLAQGEEINDRGKALKFFNCIIDDLGYKDVRRFTDLVIEEDSSKITEGDTKFAQDFAPKFEESGNDCGDELDIDPNDL